MPIEKRSYDHLAPPGRGTYSRAVRDGDWLFVSGLAAFMGSDNPPVPEEIETQTERVFSYLKGILEAEGGGFEDLVSTQTFLTDVGDFRTVNEIRGRVFGDARPASAMIVVAALGLPDLKIEISAVAHFSR